MAEQKILVIDDSPTIHRVIRHALKPLACQVESANSGEEGLQKARSWKPTLILLDFMMPALNGYQVCKALRREAELERVPVILLSSKGEAVGERLVKTMGIIDYITKPFSPEALLTLVQHVIERGANVSAEGAAETLLQVGERDPSLPPTSEDLSDPRGREAVRGQLTMIPIAEVFQLLRFQGHNGILHVARGEAHVEVFLRDGRIVFAQARNVDEEFLLGRFLVEEGAISGRDLDLFLQHRQGTRQRLGEQLVKLGQVQPEQLRRALRAQTAAMVYEILRWGEGEFVFYVTQKLPAEAVEAEIELSIDELLMEGFRRVDEWGLIEKEIRDFNLVLAPARDSTGIIRQVKLDAEEERLLALVDGKRTIREIIRLSRRSSFDVCKLLYRLLASRIVRRRSLPAPARRGEATDE